MSARDWLDKDFYAVLGVAKDATPAQLKKAYRALARELHPDTNASPGAEERFKEVSEAYDVLSDATTRAEYDEVRTYAGAGRYAQGGGSGGFSGVNLDDLFGGGGRAGAGSAGFDLGDLLGGYFGGGRPGGAKAARRGGDIDTETTISFDDALQGTTVGVTFASDVTCEACHGTGARPGTGRHRCPGCGGQGQVLHNAGGFAVAETCPTCRGTGEVIEDPCGVCRGAGRVRRSRTVRARLPAGVRNNARIRLRGKGQPGERGAPAGDLFVRVHVRPDPVFRREGDDLCVTVPVRYDEAALGASVEVPLPAGGTVTLRVPEGTQSGRTFRVRGRGVHTASGDGDLLATVEVVVPQRLTGAARRALDDLRAASAMDDPRADLLARNARTRT